MTSETAIDEVAVVFHQWLFGRRAESLPDDELSLLEDAFRFAWNARWEREKAKMLEVLTRNINQS